MTPLISHLLNVQQQSVSLPSSAAGLRCRLAPFIHGCISFCALTLGRHPIGSSFKELRNTSVKVYFLQMNLNLHKMEPPVGRVLPLRHLSYWPNAWQEVFLCLFNNYSCFLNRMFCLEISSAEQLNSSPLISAVLKFLHGITHEETHPGCPSPVLCGRFVPS